MDMVVAFGLVVAAAASSAAPGPCILLASCRSATRGLLSGLHVTLGIVGSKVLLLMCSWGVILGLLRVGEATQNAVRLGGVVILIGLALTMLAARPVPLAGARVLGYWRLGDGALGLAVGLSSPLNLIFILALLPQFVDLERLDVGLVALASAAVLLGGVLPLVAACIFSSRLLGSRPETMRHLTRVCGVALLGFAGLALVAGP